MARNLNRTISSLMAKVADIPLAEPAAALWDFALDFYALPDVSGALIELQDRAGLDVNLILFALWHGLSGRGRLNGEKLAAADKAVGMLRIELIEPLRVLRRRLAMDRDADIQRLRAAIKEVELGAEKIALARLAGCAGPLIASVDAAERLGAANGNFALYLGSVQTCGAAGLIRQALQGFARR
jgi:uncharacterized protein (TIGR02444 family)